MNMMISRRHDNRLAVNIASKINNCSKVNSSKNATIIAALATASLLLFASALSTTAGFAQAQQQTNTPPALTVPTSPLALGASTGSASGTTAIIPVVLASYVSASDREDGSLSSQIQCSSETNTLRPATNT